MTWGLLVAGLLLGMAWATLHFWIVPRISEFRPALETMARQALGVPVRIGGLTAHSTGWVPSFELRDLALLDPQGQATLRLPKAWVAISLRSALRLRLDQLVLDAPELDIHLNAQGQWRVAGLPWGQTSADSVAADWLFSQREVVVRGAMLHWDQERPSVQAPGPNASHAQAQTHANNRLPPMAYPTTRLSFRDVDVVLRNTARRHDLRVDVTPPEGWGERFVLMGRFSRGLLSTHPARWADWSGQVYADFAHVRVAPWLAQLPERLTRTWHMAGGQGAVRLWGDVDKGQWTGGLLDVALTGLKVAFQPHGSPLTLTQVSGRLGGKWHGKGFELWTRDVAFVDTSGLNWAGGKGSLDYTYAQGTRPALGRIRAEKLDLLALRQIALHMGRDEPLWARLQEHTMAGQVQALQWQWQGDWQAPTHYDTQWTISQLLLRHDAPKPGSQPWPGIQNADVSIQLSSTGGRLDLRMPRGGTVFLPTILQAAEVPVRQLTAFATWEKKKLAHGSVWQVPQWHVKLANADVQGEWHGQWRQDLTGGGPGWLDLQGVIAQADAAAVHRYLPLQLPELSRHYVRDAVVKGRYSGVKTKLKGNLANWPFQSAKDGDFSVSGRLTGVQFDMVPPSLLPATDPRWPQLHALQGQLSFDRTGVKLTDASARFGENPNAVLLKAASVDIADMRHDPRLQLEAEGTGDAAQFLAVVQQSPLDQMLSQALHNTQATGAVQLRLKLGLPLLNLKGSQVQGSVILAGNDVRMTAATPWLEKVHGTVQFNESGFQVTHTQAQLMGGAVVIDADMRPSATPGAASPLTFDIQGRLSAEGLRAAKDVDPLNVLAQHLTGSSTYKARLSWHQGYPQLSVHSTLQGLAIALPSPLGKTAQTLRPLSLNIRSQGQGPQWQDHIQLQLGNQVSAHYVRDLSGQQPQVLRGALALGVPPEQAPALPDSGVTALVALDHLLIDEWKALVPPPAQAPGERLSESTALLAYLPTRIGLKAQTLTAEGRTLHQVTAGGIRDAHQWQMNVDAQELSGHVRYRPSAGDQQGLLFARFSRLTLPPSSAKDVESWLETPPIQLPALDIVVDALELRGKKMGKVDIEAVNNTAARASSVSGVPGVEWQLKKFNITLPEGSLRSTGRWLAAHAGKTLRQTEMNFVLDVQNAGDLLNRLGTPEALRGGTGQLEGVIRWQGSPLALHYPSLDGQFEVRMGRGQFLKADAGAAKLLGVLSLQALPRRLMLDFRDVFSEGFAFDSVQGRVNIAQGMAQTQNLQIRGVNALVQLDGTADIARETQQLRVLILPVVDAGTASLLAGIAVNPVVGLTTFLAQLFLQSPLSRASAQEFLIDGSWTNPRVTRVDLRTTPAQTP
ncbi:MAG: TIGR02099 family protein [Limnohabitans sp.]|nr:TIGR02099 family protein [Limnohabitans sp.]